MSRFTSSRPRWLRRLAAANAVTLAWSLALSGTAQALSRDLAQPRPRLGLRVLSPADMGKIVGGITGVAPAPGNAQAWQASVAGVNTANGDKLTRLPIVGWTGRGGLSVSFALVHNSQSTRNGPLGAKWSHSYDQFLTVDGSGNVSVHNGDDSADSFVKNVDGSYTPPVGVHDTLVKNANGTYTLTTPAQTQYRYNAAGQLTAIADQNGNSVGLSYDAAGKLTTISDPTSRTLTLAYNAQNRIATITDPLSRVWTIGYDGSGNLTTLAQPPVNAVSYTTTLGYNAAHDITSVQNPRGYTSTLGYNADDSAAWMQDALGNRVTFTYNAASTVVTDANGQATTLAYTGGRVTSVTDPTGAHEDYAWDASNNKTQVTDKRGFAWAYTFDGMGNVLTSKDPYLNTTTTTYSPHNRLLTVTDPLNHVTTFTYDAQDNPATVKDALGHTTTLTFGSFGLLQSKKDVLNHTASFLYDTNGNTSRATDGNGNYTEFTYNALGWRTGQSTAQTGASSSTTFDSLGRPTTQTGKIAVAAQPGAMRSHGRKRFAALCQMPIGGGGGGTGGGSGGSSETSTTAYDANGNVTSATDPNGHTTTTTYDALDRVLTVTKANGDKLTFTYDGLLPNGTTTPGQKGRLTSQTDGNAHAIVFGYTVRGEKASAAYADGTSESWTYWPTGAVKTHTDGKGQSIAYGLDNAGKATGITYPAGTGTSRSATTTRGRRVSMSDGTGTTGYTFDNANRLTTVASPNGTVSYGYDDANRRTTMTLAGTGSWTYAYDAGNRLTTTTNPYAENSVNTYDAGNRLTQTTNGNSSVTTYAYDLLDRATDVWHKTGAGAVLGHYAYVYNSGGDVTQRTDADGSVTTFGYDNADQLTSEQKSGANAYTVGYTYDHNGNRLTKTLNGSTASYSYDAHDKLQSAGAKTYGYDLNGNCTTVTTGGQTTTLTYDAENRATQITYPGGATNTFAYNGLGLHVSKNDSGGAFAYVCDGTDVASAVLKDGAAVYTPGQSERRGTASKFTHADALGSTRGVTDSTQATTDATLFDAFGQVVSKTGTTPTPFGFVGASQYQTDKDSGLLLLGHRYYDPSIGRFISSDPAKQGSNWYKYADNNPLGKVDPQGLQAIVGPVPGLPDIQAPLYDTDRANRLSKSIDRHAREIEKRRGELDEDILDLPETDPNDITRPRLSRRGHRQLIDDHTRHMYQDLGELEDLIGRELPIDLPNGPGNRQGSSGSGGDIFGNTTAKGVILGVGVTALLTAAAVILITSCMGACFEGNTLVTMADGSHKPISQIHPGDWVLSRNDQTGATTAKRVNYVTVTEVAGILSMTFQGENEIKVTGNHPFYVANHGFVPAQDITTEMQCQRLSTDSTKLTAATLVAVGKRKVYNLEVDDFHTYFVGKHGLWVRGLVPSPAMPKQSLIPH